MSLRIIVGPILLGVALLSMLGVPGCKDAATNPSTIDTLETLTPNHVILTLTNIAYPADSVVAVYDDPDGSGSGAATIDTLRPASGVNYTGQLTFQFRGRLAGRTADTVLDLTPTYRRLGTKHQIFYTLDGPDAARTTITVTDRDTKNLPLGVATFFAVAPGGAGSATLHIQLGYYSDTARPKDGTLAPYQSDFDALFPVILH
ncbi:MAG TPA: hypothetical protein VHI13_07980 [Candidatus Kapabacteria bacterium]|nr:hypothetical protein [Candidatus Kapabacteria bacterium]